MRKMSTESLDIYGRSQSIVAITGAPEIKARMQARIHKLKNINSLYEDTEGKKHPATHTSLPAPLLSTF